MSPEAEERSRFWFVPYLYLLRVQIITALAMIALPIVALYPQPSPLLNGLFDLNYASPARSVSGMAIVTLAAFATSWTLLATTWTAVANAAERFGTSRVRFVSFPIRWQDRGLFSIVAMPVVAGAIRHSWSVSGVSRVSLLLGVVIGLAVAVVCVAAVGPTEASLRTAIRRPQPRAVARRIDAVLRWIAAKPNVREGYVDADGTPRPGHLQAVLVFAVSLGLYIAVGISKFVRVGYPPFVPTLGAVLLLMLILCWAAAGLAFFFDRYRVPVLIPLLALPSLSASLPLSDHIYRTTPHYPGYSATPGELLVLSDAPVILAAASGGGIQSAAWTTRVLTGLNLAARQEFGDRFERSVRLISAVSGGAIGAMYFVNQYADGKLSGNFESAVKQAEASSLDDVAWGAAYPDLVRLVLPVFRVDRGQALEWAWTRDGGVAAPLSRWRDDVYALNRPAVILNATIVDTGERLLIGSARVGWDATLGLRNFEDVYPGTDVQVVTAARLSASFPFISPAARADLAGRQYHVVDGSYYDNFGTTTLMQWLEQALEDARPLPKRVLVLQIRAAPPDSRAAPDNSHGWFYQAWAPLEAMLDVRTTGQLSHNEEDFQRLQALWASRGVEIDNAVFQFCGERPPLSWHLTGRDKDAIESAWTQELETGGAWQVVRAFLAGSPVPSQPAWTACGQ
jgi:hypothetical protein